MKNTREIVYGTGPRYLAIYDPEKNVWYIKAGHNQDAGWYMAGHKQIRLNGGTFLMNELLELHTLCGEIDKIEDQKKEANPGGSASIE